MRLIFFAKICCPYLDIRGAVQLVDGRDHGISVDISQALRQLLFALLGLGIVYNDFDGGRFPHRVTSWYVCLLQFIVECLSDMTVQRHLAPWSGGNGPLLRPGGGCLLGRQNDDPGCAPDRCSNGIS